MLVELQALELSNPAIPQRVFRSGSSPLICKRFRVFGERTGVVRWFGLWKSLTRGLCCADFQVGGNTVAAVIFKSAQETAGDSRTHRDPAEVGNQLVFGAGTKNQ